jgi:hypothetical protein
MVDVKLDDRGYAVRIEVTQMLGRNRSMVMTHRDGSIDVFKAQGPSHVFRNGIGGNGFVLPGLSDPS